VTIPIRYSARALAAGIVYFTTIAPATLTAQQGKRVVEHAEFEVKLGFVPVGTGQLTVFAYDTVDGHSTFHSILSITGGLGPAKVRDRFESWGDATSWRNNHDVFSRRFVQDIHEVTYRRNTSYEISPERGEWVKDDGTKGRINDDKPLDDLTMLFFARSLPLKVGDTYSIPRYFISEGNPVILRVLRREVITVPAGTFQTVVVQPTIKTSGLFSEGGEAELYFTDDRFHSLIQLKSKVKVIGSLTLRLKKYQRPDVADDPAYARK
jgi:Protein of unknown function (DUF3108)